MPTAVTGKIGPKDVNPSSKGTGMAGNPGKVMPSKAFEGPASPGQPPSMKKALAKKALKGGNATGFAGTVR